MTDITTLVKVDRTDPPDFVYETDITSKVLNLNTKAGRSADSPIAQVGTMSAKINNAAGTYTPAAGASAIRPLQPIEVTVDAQDIFHGFVRRVYLEPSGDEQTMTLDCADWLYILARRDISRPLMRDVRSHILAHRIVDAAEVGEHIDNPSFKSDTTGYSKIDGGETMTRMTTDPVMEGAASCYVVTDAAAEGIRYTIPHDADGDFQSKKATASVYVINDGGSASNVILRVADSGGNRGASAATALTDQVQRIEATGTFDGAATDFYVDIEQDGAGTRAFRVLAVHCVFYESAIPRDFDEGQNVFAYVGPRRMKALEALREVAMNEMGYLYVNGAGTLMFEDKCHRWRETASIVSQGTVDETMVAMPYEEDVDDRVGEVELGYMRWELGEAGTSVWGLQPLPRYIPANGTLTIDIDYGEGALVRDVITPVANTDYTITNAAGVDATGSVALAFEDYGGGAQAVFTDSGGVDLTLDSFNIRATPVRPSTDSSQVTYTPSGAPAVASKIAYRYEWLGDKFVTQRSRMPPVLVNKSAALVTEMTERVISDRVTLVNDDRDYSAKVNGPFHIEGISHHLDMGKTWMETRWLCTPVWNKSTDEQYYWRLDTGELGDAATATTTTALGP
jgi:hypothetical protein